ncbi:MAG: hypothetical protein ACM3ZQ_10550, partial [Bacillota bacterium]
MYSSMELAVDRLVILSNSFWCQALTSSALIGEPAHSRRRTIVALLQGASESYVEGASGAKHSHFHNGLPNRTAQNQRICLKLIVLNGNARS